jgi:hypothetical protein
MRKKLKSLFATITSSAFRIKRLTAWLLLVPFSIITFSCKEHAKNEPASTVKEESNSQPHKRPPNQDLTKGKGSLSFKLDGQLYTTDPQHTKCWTTASVPLAMLMAKGEGLSISWQMGYEEGKNSYKLDGDRKGTINFTIGGKTYWTRSVKGDNYLDIIITDVKNKYSLKMLSGTFEGVLEDKDGKKVQITEGRFATDDI